MEETTVKPDFIISHKGFSHIEQFYVGGRWVSHLIYKGEKIEEWEGVQYHNSGEYYPHICDYCEREFWFSQSNSDDKSAHEHFRHCSGMGWFYK
jgi:hypothetical protein